MKEIDKPEYYGYSVTMVNYARQDKEHQIKRCVAKSTQNVF